jgi:hypothetical protein
LDSREAGRTKLPALAQPCLLPGAPVRCIIARASCLVAGLAVCRRLLSASLACSSACSPACAWSCAWPRVSCLPMAPPLPVTASASGSKLDINACHSQPFCPFSDLRLPAWPLLRCTVAGSMAKFVPYLHALAPSLPLLSPGYSATECVAGLASSLLEASFKLPLGGSPGVPAPGSPSRAAAATRPAESYVLLPHISCFYEFLSQSNGRVCRWGQGRLLPQCMLRHGSRQCWAKPDTHRPGYSAYAPAYAVSCGQSLPSKRPFSHLLAGWSRFQWGRHTSWLSATCRCACPWLHLCVPLPIITCASRPAGSAAMRQGLLLPVVQGLLRYRLGDALCCTRFFGATPKVRQPGRQASGLAVHQPGRQRRC